MKLVLTDNVSGVGDIGETVEVRNGFGRNFLVPRGLALEVSSRNAKLVRHKMSHINAKKQAMKSKADEVAKGLRDITLTFSLRVGSGGKIFGSIGAKDIAARLVADGIEVDRRRVMLTEPIKKVGVHFVAVKLHPEVVSQIRVVVEKLDATASEEHEETREARDRIEVAKQ